MLASLVRRRTEERSTFGGISWQDYLRLFEEFGFNGVEYVVSGGGIAELTADQARRNPIVWACISLRAFVFSQARFIFEEFANEIPGKQFSAAALQPLQKPWVNGTTRKLLVRVEVDGSLYGNSFWYRRPGSKWLTRLDPTRMQIATTDVLDQTTGAVIGRELIGYLLKDRQSHTVAAFLPEEIAHYMPMADPECEFRGISWLSALISDIVADGDLTEYKHSFLKNAAVPSLVLTFNPGVAEDSAKKLQEKLNAKHTGPSNAFKTLSVSSAVSDVKIVGSNFDQLNLNEVQGAGEVRIAAAAGVPPSLVSISEGLGGSALNAGNYGAIRRQFSDSTIRSLWEESCGAFSAIAPPQGTARLWYRDKHIPFLQEDKGQAADIQVAQSATIINLINSGYEPDSVIQAVTTGDFTVLKHTGMTSVQLQPPGSIKPTLPPRVPPIPDD